MALKFSMESPSILRVDEYIYGWTSTRHQVARYDLVNLKSRVDDDPWRDMPQWEIEWVNKYYLPKVKELKGE